MKWKVTLKSKDNNIFEFTTMCDDSVIAKARALKEIANKGWTQYGYKVIRVQEI